MVWNLHNISQLLALVSLAERTAMRFRDRQEAGRQLAAALKPYAEEHPIVVALPRGGVPVGYEVALADAPQVPGSF
jgi:hypothetical protein